MEIIAIAIISFALRLIVSAIDARKSSVTTVFTNDRTSLCRDCAYAHIARGFRDRDELIACTYAGAMRPIKFAVSDCTMFCSRNANTQIVRIIGFAQNELDQSVSPSIAAKTE